MSLALRVAAAAIVIVGVNACQDMPTARPKSLESSVPAATAATLDPTKMERIRQFSDGGCGVSTVSPAGDLRGFSVRRQDLPFNVSPIVRDVSMNRGNGRPVRFTVRAPGRAPMQMDCWIPTSEDLSSLIKPGRAAKSARWTSLLKRVSKARVIPSAAVNQPLSNETLELEKEVLAPGASSRSAIVSAAAFDGLCGVFIKTTINLWDDDADGWFTVTIEFYGCNDGFDIFGWIIDNGYEDTPHVVVDADAYDVSALDSVTFTADVVSGTRLPAYGWVWKSSSGSNDAWTHACVGNSTTCKIQLHGTGRMYYQVDNSGDTLQADVGV